MDDAPQHPFRGSVRKIDRAATHLHSLQEEIKGFFERHPEPYRTVEEIDRRSSRYLLRVQIEHPFPDWWGLIVGDCVQNLRAALDHLVCQLVYDKGEEPTWRHAFPLFTEPVTRRTWKNRTAKLDPQAVAFIERYQPYHHPDGARSHLLFALRELSNEDKHRLLLPAVGAVRRPDEPPDVNVLASHDVGPLNQGKLHTEYALKDGDLIMEAPIQITGPNPQIKTELTLGLDIGFGTEPIVPLKALVRMFDSVRLIVREAARILRGYTGP
jgi:hypothetical protein